MYYMNRILASRHKFLNYFVCKVKLTEAGILPLEIRHIASTSQY